MALNEIVLLLSSPIDHLLVSVRDIPELRAEMAALEAERGLPTPSMRVATPVALSNAKMMAPAQKLQGAQI